MLIASLAAILSIGIGYAVYQQKLSSSKIEKVDSVLLCSGVSAFLDYDKVEAIKDLSSKGQEISDQLETVASIQNSFLSPEWKLWKSKLDSDEKNMPSVNFNTREAQIISKEYFELKNLADKELQYLWWGADYLLTDDYSNALDLFKRSCSAMSLTVKLP